MERKPIILSLGPYTLSAVILAALVGIDLLFLVFTTNVAKTVTLLKKEAATLEQDKQIISSSEQLYDTYRKEIELISAVFPNEETFPTFIRTLEDLIRIFADEYTVKFTSLTPLVEQEKLFLLLSLSMKTDNLRLTQFLVSLEQLPYMTHVTSIQAKTPEGFTGQGEVTLGLKLYVKNPFVATK